MFDRFITPLVTAAALGLVAMLAFAGVSHAANAAVPPDGSLLDLLGPLYRAFAGGQYAFAAASLVVVLVAGVKYYFGDAWTWVHTDAGGAALALAGSSAAAIATALAAPGASVTGGLLWSSLGIGVAAAGGYAAVKHLLVVPVLRPLRDRAPAWLRGVFDKLLWVFDGKAVTVGEHLDRVLEIPEVVAADLHVDKPAPAPAPVIVATISDKQ